MSILLQNVLVGDRRRDVLIQGNRIAGVEGGKAEEVIDCRNRAVIPGLVNTHTHAAMTLLRGYAEDMDLKAWLETRIWPREAKILPDDIYWGTKLACLEMIRSGTTTFNDMYFHMDRAALAVKETGMRAVLSEGFIDVNRKETAEVLLANTESVHRQIAELHCDRITVAWGPHAWYTVSAESLKAIAERAERTKSLVHIHVSETKKEVEDCQKAHGKTPPAYLDSLGILSDRTIAAHGCWLTEEDAMLLSKRGASVSHNPVSNMKLSSGRLDMPMLAYFKVNLALGTDGAASNNSLSMLETMKFAALLQKHAAGTPTAVDARHVLSQATVRGARALHLEAGEIAPGKLADLVLLDLKAVGMVPLHSLAANVVYAANPTAVTDVICDGKFIMKDRRVPGEEEILEKGAAVAADLMGRT